jgi:alpha-beta hydrolase superfamily lysophospholipase
MKSAFLSLLFICSAAMAQSTSTMIRVESLDSWKTDCRLRVVVQAPKGTAKGDVLFLIGFGDRADNHSPLFNAIVNSGFRVFSFDYPAHGESDCGSINFSSFKELMTAASAVEQSVRAGSKAPLFLIGPYEGPPFTKPVLTVKIQFC